MFEEFSPHEARNHYQPRHGWRDLIAPDWRSRGGALDYEPWEDRERFRELDAQIAIVEGPMERRTPEVMVPFFASYEHDARKGPRRPPLVNAALEPDEETDL